VTRYASDFAYMSNKHVQGAAKSIP